MDHDHMHGMIPASSSMMMNNTKGSMMDHPHGHMMMMMHMTFFWGTTTEVVFSGWPGISFAIYALCIFVVFLSAFATEFLANSAVLRRRGSASRAAGLVQTAVYTVRTGLAYLVMLALMSFHGGVFLAGHASGFLVFGSRVFRDVYLKFILTLVMVRILSSFFCRRQSMDFMLIGSLFKL